MTERKIRVNNWQEHYYIEKTVCGECHKHYMKKVYVCKMPGCDALADEHVHPIFYCKKHDMVEF